MTTESLGSTGARRGFAKLSVDLSAAEIESIEQIRQKVTALRSNAPIALQIKSPDWTMNEQHSGPAAVAERLREVCRLLSVPQGRLLHHPCSAQPMALESNMGNCITSVFRCLESRRFTLSGEAIRKIDGLGLWRRSIVLAADSDEDGLTYRYIGSAHRKRFGNWTTEAIGRPFSYGDAANPFYSQWVSRFYEPAFHSKTPVRHLVDSLINHRQPAALPDRTNYDRLLAPIRFVDGRRGLLVVSQVTPGLVPLAPCSAQGPEAAQPASSRPRRDPKSPG